MRIPLVLAVAAVLALPATAAGAAPKVNGLILQPSQVGAGYQLFARKDGVGVRGTVTLDLCGVDYPSEKLRTERLQVNYAKGRNPLVLSNEVVRYKPGGAQQAMREVLHHALNCPRRPVSPGVEGLPPLRFRITRIAGPHLLEGYVAVRVRTTGTVNGKHVDQISYAVYQRLGNVLSGVYSFGPPTAAQQRFCLHAAEQSARNLRRGGIAAKLPTA